MILSFVMRRYGYLRGDQTFIHSAHKRYDTVNPRSRGRPQYQVVRRLIEIKDHPSVGSNITPAARWEKMYKHFGDRSTYWSPPVRGKALR